MRIFTGKKALKVQRSFTKQSEKVTSGRLAVAEISGATLGSNYSFGNSEVE